MSIHTPEAGWFKAPTGGERTWLALALSWCLVMTAMMPYWHLFGKQNSTGEAYTVEPAAFMARAQKQVDQYKVDTVSGVPVVEPPPGSDVYVVARMWNWWPVLKLKKDQTYRLHLSSMDLQHGFGLQPMNMNFQVLPGYDHVLTITPTSAGEFPVVCNEFCGVGHHMMAGRIIVTE